MVDFTTEFRSPEQGLVYEPYFPADEKSPVFEPITVTVYADLLKVRVPSGKDFHQQPPPPRSEITRFSARSRKRMMESVARTRNRLTGGYFVTLTYPGEFRFSPDEVKNHLKNIKRRLERAFTGISGHWRMELKRRKSGKSAGAVVPHFHLLVAMPSTEMTAQDFRAWLALAWWEVVGSQDDDHRRAGTQADLIRNRRHAGAYVSKYAAKEEETYLTLENNWGRRWGVFGDIEQAAVLVASVSREQMIELKRLVVRWMKSKGIGYGKRLARATPQVGFSAFGLGDVSCDQFGDQWTATIGRMVLAVAL